MVFSLLPRQFVEQRAAVKGDRVPKTTRPLQYNGSPIVDVFRPCTSANELDFDASVALEPRDVPTIVSGVRLFCRDVRFVPLQIWSIAVTIAGPIVVYLAREKGTAFSRFFTSSVLFSGGQQFVCPNFGFPWGHN